MFLWPQLQWDNEILHVCPPAFIYWKHFGGKWVKPFFLNILFFLCCFWQILESFFIVCFIFWFFFAKAFLLRFLAFFLVFFCSSFFFLCILKHGDESTFYWICATERFRSWRTVILGHNHTIMIILGHNNHTNKRRIMSQLGLVHWHAQKWCTCSHNWVNWLK